MRIVLVVGVICGASLLALLLRRAVRVEVVELAAGAASAAPQLDVDARHRLAGRPSSAFPAASRRRAPNSGRVVSVSRVDRPFGSWPRPGRRSRRQPSAGRRHHQFLGARVSAAASWSARARFTGRFFEMKPCALYWYFNSARRRPPRPRLVDGDDDMNSPCCKSTRRPGDVRGAAARRKKREKPVHF